MQANGLLSDDVVPEKVGEQNAPEHKQHATISNRTVAIDIAVFNSYISKLMHESMYEVQVAFIDIKSAQLKIAIFLSAITVFGFGFIGELLISLLRYR